MRLWHIKLGYVLNLKVVKASKLNNKIEILIKDNLKLKKNSFLT